MIFAEIDHPKDYLEFHEELKEFLRNQFPGIRSGLQSDSWFWIFDGDQKVALDTFSSLKHQVKSGRPGAHVQQVIDVLLTRYKVHVYAAPLLEGHEDE